MAKIVQQAKAILYAVSEADRPEAMMNFDFVRRRVKLEIAMHSLDINTIPFIKEQLRSLEVQVAKDGSLTFLESTGPFLAVESLEDGQYKLDLDQPIDFRTQTADMHIIDNQEPTLNVFGTMYQNPPQG